jgi:hypothetical protein
MNRKEYVWIEEMNQSKENQSSQRNGAQLADANSYSQDRLQSSFKKR